ncbi:MAG: DUF4595 domain-containing protein [Bacteroidaceae bacterium]|nr:DUF4595 domain-containing protein [Bacteroidaceae bacterium]
MRTLRKFGMALFAVLVCANFAACSSDDTASNGVGGKKMSKLVYEKYRSYTTAAETTTFDYGVDGKLVLASCDDYDNHIFEFNWSDDMIERICLNDNSSPRGYILKNNLVQKVKADHDFGDRFVYNGANILEQWMEPSTSYEYTYTTSATWDGDKLMSITTKGGNQITRKKTITYGGRCSAGYNPLILYLFYDGELFYAHPELLGLRNNQLPVSVTTESFYSGDNSVETCNYEYEFDDAGYITKIVGKVDNEILRTWTITWE